MTREALPREYKLATALYPGPDWKAARVDEGGQFHLVLVAEGEAVMRMSRTAEAARQMQRRVDLVQALEGRFSFQLPAALSEVWHGDGCSAVIQRYVPGAPHLPHTGDATRLRAVLEELAAVEVGPLAPLLAPPFSFRGPWTAPKIEATLEALPAELAGAAQRVLDALPGFEAVAPALVHGDLAGHNMRWRDGELLGILDWDLAAAWDPALNTAYLGLWHGAHLLEDIAPSLDVAWRARIWLGAMSLESVYDASLNPGRDSAALIGKIRPRLMAAAEAARG
ncbi:phosphotransferase family protein [Paeniglutamicibacter sp. MACA_103]|uniref:phosphotransferase family protein n=1 Tax=Paeniglutamicibacter sp. MACA_103 TaxID=3377337 RepID=UPI003895B50B